MQGTADIALIGLAVMGQNLVLNMNDRGFQVAVYNRTPSKVTDFLEGPARGTHVAGATSLEELVGLLNRPRKIMFMVRAGTAVDELIEKLLPLLDDGDILIDGGNSHFQDTERRVAALRQRGIHFLGMGVSGGEEGARHGPSLMPGGSPEAWPAVQDLFQAIAARVSDGSPCCDWMGDGGAGHFVKMVHNGIEYGDMQLIAEAYDLMRNLAGMAPDAIGEVFQGWNQGPLKSYLVEITAEILHRRDADGSFLIDAILDAAGQKGTGKWTAINALELGIPLTLIAEAVWARSLSALHEERQHASRLLQGPKPGGPGVSVDEFLEDLQKALYASKILSYAQGYMLLRSADREFNWNLNLGGIALVWRAGCIIRSAFLDRIHAAFTRQADLENLLVDSDFREEVGAAQGAWRRTVGRAVQAGIPVPAMASGLAFYDGYRRERLPANLIQAQRDYFGAHTYERVDRPRGQFFHTDWAGTTT
jgi:6-phosphogluconate dehydrogenase